MVSDINVGLMSRILILNWGHMEKPDLIEEDLLLSVFLEQYGECGGGMGRLALPNCCSVVNIFILSVRVRSGQRGTSHSRSAELHDQADAAGRSISIF